MRKLMMGLLGAAALTAGSGAQAATTVPGTYNSIDTVLLNLLGTEGYGETLWGGGIFSTSYGFSLFSAYSADSQISSVFTLAHDVDFTSIYLDGYAFTQSAFDPSTETWQLLLPVNLAAGAHTVTVNGNVTGTTGIGSYVGNIDLGGAVPEPSTWAMMLLGFGAVGFSIRRRRRPALLHSA